MAHATTDLIAGGKSIYCPHCNNRTTVYHLQWSALQCYHCRTMVDINDWHTNFNIKSTMHLKSSTSVLECPCLSTKAKRLLARRNIETIQDILDFGLDRIQSIHQAGPKTTSEVQSLLRMYQAQQNEYYYLEEVRSILKNVLARESKRHQMDEHLVPGTADVIEEIIAMLEEQLDYDPTPHELGEPPITMDEMHTAAWKEHQAMHR